MSVPWTVKVEVAFVAAPYGTLTWTDVSQWVTVDGFTTTRGRAWERATTDAGTLTITFDNTDGRFDPTNGSSPYSPNVLPYRPIRVTATYLGVSYPVWRGFVERWPQSWAANGDRGVVSLTAVDGFKAVLGRTFGARYTDLVASQSPLVYVRMNGDAAAGNNAWVNSSAVAASPIAGDTDTASIFQNPGTTQQFSWPYTWATPTAVAFGGNYTADFWMRWDSATTINAGAQAVVGAPFATMLHQAVTSPMIGPTTTWPGEMCLFLTGTAPVTFRVKLYTGTATGFLDTGYDITCDDTWRHYAVQVDNASGVATPTMRFYVNGTLVYTGNGAVSTTGTLLSWAPTRTGFDQGGTTSRWTLLQFEMDELVLTSGLVSPAQRYYTGSHYTQFAAEAAGARIGHVLDAVGWPTADRVIDSGATQLQATGSVEGSTALSLMQDAATTDGGNVFIDAQGRVAFYWRQHAYAAGYTTAATFGESGYPYEGGIVVDFDDTYIYNDIEITQANSSPVYVGVGIDTTSQSQYGIRSYQATLPHASTADSDGLAGYLLQRYKNPHPRIATLTMEGTSAKANLPQMLGREIGDVVTVTRTPPGAPALSLAVVIEGVQHQVSGDTWRTTFLISPAYTPWIVGDAVYGVLDVTTVTAY